MKNTYDKVKHDSTTHLSYSDEVTSGHDIPQNQWQQTGRDLGRIAEKSDHFVAGLE